MRGYICHEGRLHLDTSTLLPRLLRLAAQVRKIIHRVLEGFRHPLGLRVFVALLSLGTCK